jgi:hypothetical protein
VIPNLQKVRRLESNEQDDSQVELALSSILIVMVVLRFSAASKDRDDNIYCSTLYCDQFRDGDITRGVRRNKS